jgi:hypothetical protein
MFTRQTCIGCINPSHGMPRINLRIRGPIPYSSKSKPFRDKIAKPLKEQLLAHSNPRNLGWNDACHLPDKGMFSLCSAN